MRLMKLKLSRKFIKLAALPALLLVLLLAYWLLGDSANVKFAKAGIEARLKDPESVKYRNIREYYPNVVCGEFDAKNGLGAYNGYQPFMYRGWLGDLDLDPDPGTYQVACSKSAKDLHELGKQLDELTSNK